MKTAIAWGSLAWMTIVAPSTSPQLLALPAEQDDAESARLAGVPARFASPEVVLAWSAAAYDVGYAEDQFLTWKAQRAMAMMHLAMHAAFNAVVPVYDRELAVATDPRADPLAAAAQAAHDVLTSQYPRSRAALDAVLEDWLRRCADAETRSHAVALGRASAQSILGLRDGDGWNAQAEYRFDRGAGSYQTTPPHAGFVAWPAFRHAKPFVLARPDQYRPGPPPPLGSLAYAEAFDEVKRQGERRSRSRTPDQAAYATWWMEFAEGSLNRLARELAGQRPLHAWQAARLFALLDMALYDTYVAVWDSKFEYRHWRPYTAIREASSDGNPRTEPDPAWEPLRPAPPFPEYVSAHAAACAAAFTVLGRLLGEPTVFTLRTQTAPSEMPARTFDSFAAAAAECADSRVQLGWHFRYSTDAGLALGRTIAEHALATRLRVLAPAAAR